MESEIEQARINSDFFDKERFQKQLDIIKQAADLAAAKVDYKSAHDDNIIRSIEIVEQFLRKKHRHIIPLIRGRLRRIIRAL